jgi:hypothetical protein
LVSKNLQNNYDIVLNAVKQYGKKASEIHPNANKRKLIIANKSSFKGVFIDDVNLGLTGTHKFYIIGNNLELIMKMLNYKICNIISHFTKYEHNFALQNYTSEG